MFWSLWGKAALEADFLKKVDRNPRKAANSEKMRMSQYGVGEARRLLDIPSVKRSMETIGKRAGALGKPDKASPAFVEMLGVAAFDRLLREKIKKQGAEKTAEEFFWKFKRRDAQLMEALFADDEAYQAMETISNDGWLISCSMALVDDPNYTHKG